MSMEYRARITIPGLPFSAEEQHDALMDALLRDHVEHGPVMSWSDDWLSTEVTVATDADEEAAAAAELTGVVADALSSAGLGGLYPAHVEIELVGDIVAA